MESSVSQQLAQLIRTNKDKEWIGPYFTDKDLADGEVLNRFHQWADGKPNHGGFLIRNLEGNAYWLLFVEQYENHRNGYQLNLYDKRRSKVLAEIHEVNMTPLGKELVWNYSPTRRDGRNEQRKKYFAEYFGDIEVRISLPTGPSELEDFLDELFSLAQVRLKADFLDAQAPDYRDSFVEGKIFQRLHSARERDPRIVRTAKQSFLEKYGHIFCQICDFDFEKKYGSHGKDFIEAHHTVPVSDLKPAGEETRPADIALVCSNCHRMLHRYRPWLTLRELKRLLAH